MLSPFLNAGKDLSDPYLEKERRVDLSCSSVLPAQLNPLFFIKRVTFATEVGLSRRISI